MKTNNPFSIKLIKVEELFGLYNYTIPKTKQDHTKLHVIYGDNGCGKTTVLRLIFSLLSTKENSGYKSKIAQTKFKKVSILFENGLEVGAERPISQFGGFIYFIKKRGKILYSVQLPSTIENTIRMTQGSPEERLFSEMMLYMRKLDISTFYLTDERRMLNTITSSENDTNSEINSRINDPDRIILHEFERTGVRNKKIALEPAIERLMNWVRTKTIIGSKTGERDSQVIFSDIFKNFIHLTESGSVNKTKEDLIRDLDEIDLKIPTYVSLGLVEKFDSKTIRSSLKRVNTPDQIKYLTTIISPYLDSINVKLKALETVQKTLDQFLSSVNDYFTNKQMSFNLSIGFSLKQIDGDDIKYSWLSSGERQLLLLLIYAITSAEEATIFIIDEPEISLNIKWQRKLLKTLLAFSSDKNLQFLIATHSIELLTANRSYVTKLETNHGRVQ